MVEPFRFASVERPVSRRFAALVLSAVALTVPLIPAIGTAADSNRYWHAVLLIWAIGAIPALLLTVVVAARPRLPRVIAGMTILEVMLIGATYLIALMIGGQGQ